VSERVAVLFNTPWTHPAEGWAIASRAYARAMHAAGIDVILRDWQRPPVALDPEVEEEMAPLLADERDARLSLHIFSSTLSSAKMMGVLDVMKNNPEPQAYYCVFERRHIEAELVEKLNRLDAVWVQCRMNQEVLRAAGVTNTTLIPYPFFEDDPHLQLDILRREPKSFYYIGRFEPRKSPDNVIRAFLRAFTPGESTLTIKTSPVPFSAPYPSPHSVIAEELTKDDVRSNGWRDVTVQRDIKIIEGRLSKQAMLELHAANDVYVTASRGEGLELPVWAAKLAGRRIITTASGGPEDFLDPDVDVVVPATGLVPADPSYQWGPDANYIDYSLDDLVEAMQTVRGQRPCGTRTWPGWEQHRAAKVAEALKTWVTQIS
jgi:glycosyltransferase involved in cell wall biosynthesis